MDFDPANNPDLDGVKDKEHARTGDAILEKVGLKDRMFYEETTAGRWWIENAAQEWVGRPNGLFDIFLKRTGIEAVRPDKGCNSDMDLAKLHISLNYGVAYAGPLAGHKKGVKQNNGHRILVTRSPQIPTPDKETAFPVLDALVKQLFGPTDNDKTDQTDFFLCWWRHSLECLMDGGHDTRGLALVLAGDAGCGKSLLKEVIRESFGGRECKPYQFMIGQEKFNGECLGSELWAIDDEQAMTDARSRSEFGANIKKIVADTTYRIRGMQRDGVNLVFFKRLLICVNREPERLIVLPQLDDDIAGKMSIFLCHTAPMPMPAGNRKDKALFWETMMEELPGLIYWLLNTYEPPPELVENVRFGAREFHHPDLCRDLFEMSREHTLLNQLNKVLFSCKDLDVTGPDWFRSLTASQMRDALIDENAPLSKGEKNHIPLPSFFGKCLTKIEREQPDRIRSRKSGGKKTWVIVKEGREVLDAINLMTANAGRKSI